MLPQNGSCPECGRHLTWLEVLVNAKAIPIRRVRRNKAGRKQSQAAAAAASQNHAGNAGGSAPAQGGAQAASQGDQLQAGRRSATRIGTSRSRGRGRGRGARAGHGASADAPADAAAVWDAAAGAGSSAGTSAAVRSKAHRNTAAASQLQAHGPPSGAGRRPYAARRGRIAAAAFAAVAPASAGAAASQAGAAHSMHTAAAGLLALRDNADALFWQDAGTALELDAGPEPPLSDASMPELQSPGAANSSRGTSQERGAASHRALAPALYMLSSTTVQQRTAPTNLQDSPEPPSSGCSSLQRAISDQACSPDARTARVHHQHSQQQSNDWARYASAGSAQRFFDWSPAPISDCEQDAAPGSAEMLLDGRHAATPQQQRAPACHHGVSGDENECQQADARRERHAAAAAAVDDHEQSKPRAHRPQHVDCLQHSGQQHGNCIDLACTPAVKQAHRFAASPEPMSCSPLLSQPLHTAARLPANKCDGVDRGIAAPSAAPSCWQARRSLQLLSLSPAKRKTSAVVAEVSNTGAADAALGVQHVNETVLGAGASRQPHAEHEKRSDAHGMQHAVAGPAESASPAQRMMVDLT